jgi:hypothetical protein
MGRVEITLQRLIEVENLEKEKFRLESNSKGKKMILNISK